MPYRPRRVRQRPRRELDELHICQLITGHVFFPDTGFADDADLQAGWAQVKEALLAWHIEACPGSRPWAWWHLEAPEPRRLHTGTPHTCPMRQQYGQDLYFGVPHVYACAACWEESYESQARYLRRFALLLPQEETIVPTDLKACDLWWVERDGIYEDHPSRQGLEGARQFLAGDLPSPGGQTAPDTDGAARSTG